MDIAEFDTLYPTPAHAAAAERRMRVIQREKSRHDETMDHDIGGIGDASSDRLRYLLSCRDRALTTLDAATDETRRAYILETIGITDRMLADLRKSALSMPRMPGPIAVTPSKSARPTATERSSDRRSLSLTGGRRPLKE